MSIGSMILARKACVHTAAAALALASLCPRRAEALPLLDERLSLERRAPPVLVVALASESAPTSDSSLDFDLLGPPPPTARAATDPSLKLRRRMLRVHQGLGLGLLGLELATTVVGQLNYQDKYGSNAPVTARYQLTHRLLAYSTLGVFAVNGGIALLAPRDRGKRSAGFDRVTLHKLGMAIAAAGMIAQGVLGTYTRTREGYLDQQRYAKAHLAIGYATVAAVGVAVGALVF